MRSNSDAVRVCSEFLLDYYVVDAEVTAVVVIVGS